MGGKAGTPNDGIASEGVTWTPPAAAAPYIPTISSAERQYNLPAGLLGRVLYQESLFHPDIIDGTLRSPAGAIGIAQVMPLTASGPGFGVPPLPDPTDPFAAIPWAAQYLRALYNALGTWDRALGAYNWGIGNVREALKADSLAWRKLAPAETQQYIAQIGADIPAVYA